MQLDHGGNKKPYRARGSRGGRRRKGSQANQAHTIYKTQNPPYNRNSYATNESKVPASQTSSKTNKNPMNSRNSCIVDKRLFSSHKNNERNERHQSKNRNVDSKFDRRHMSLDPSHSKLSPCKHLRLNFKRTTASVKNENHDFSFLPQPPPLVESCSSFSSQSSSGVAPHLESYYSEYDNCKNVNGHELTLITTSQQLDQQAGIETFCQQHPSPEAYEEECWGGSFFSTSPRSFLMGRNV